jgi:hypothetical protein
MHPLPTASDIRSPAVDKGCITLAWQALKNSRIPTPLHVATWIVFLCRLWFVPWRQPTSSASRSLCLPLFMRAMAPELALGYCNTVTVTGRSICHGPALGPFCVFVCSSASSATGGTWPSGPESEAGFRAQGSGGLQAATGQQFAALPRDEPLVVHGRATPRGWRDRASP